MTVLPAFLSGGGDCARLIASRDWHASPLGPIDGWSASLRTATSLLLRSPVPIVMLWGEDGVMLYNDAYSVFAGGRHPTLLGSPVREGWPEVADFNDRVMRVGLAGETLSFRDQELVLYRHGRPERVTLDLDYSPVPGDDGKPAGVLAIVVETTERVRAQKLAAFRVGLDDRLRRATGAVQAQQQAVEWLGTTLGADLVSIARLESDQEHAVIDILWPEQHVAAGAGRYRIADFGHDRLRPIFVGEPVIVPDVEQLNDDAAVQGYRLFGLRATLEVPLVRQGETRWLIGVGSKRARDWSEDDLALARETADRLWDTVERLEAEQARTESERRLRAVFDNAAVGVARVDFTSASFIEVNDALCAITGYSRDELIGRSWIDITHPDDVGIDLKPFERMARGEIESYCIEKRYLRRNGSHIWVRLTLSLVRDSEGRPDFEICVVEDIAEPRQRQASLESRTAELEALFASAPIGIAFFDREHRWVRINAELATVNGFSIDHHIGRRIEDLLPVNAAAVSPMLDRVFATGEALRAVEVTGSVPHEPRRERTWLVSYYPVRDAHGAIAAVGTWVVDITERKRIEAEVRASEARFRALIDSVSDAFYSIDRDFRLTICNPAAAQYLNLDLSTAIGKTIFEAGGFPNTEQSRQIYAKFLAKAVDAPVEVESFAKPGRYIELRTSRVPDDGWAISFTDVTERHRAERELRESEARLRAVIEAAPVGLVFADETGQVTHGNRYVEQLVGHPVLPSKLDEYHEWVSFHPDGRRVQSEEYPLARVLRGEPSPADLEVHYERGDGRRTWIRFIASSIRDADGKVQGGVVASLDIDALRRAEEDLRRLNEELAEEVERAVSEREDALARLHEAQKLETIGQLTGGVAHDFNNLLTPIVGSLDLLKRQSADPRTSRLLDAALQSADRAKTLVQRLLAFARRQTLQPVPVNVAQLVGGMRDLIDRSLGPTITVDLALADGLPPALVDPNQLELALLNLAVNARDAMPQGGRLAISAIAASSRECPTPGLTDGDYIRLEVADTGSGMDEDTLRRAVEPFFSTKGLGKGTGLGLSMVHGLAHQSGGLFKLTSEPGRGTRAILWLPVAATPVERPVATGDDLAEDGKREATILLVDDEPLVRATTAESLRELGYRVEEAGGGEEAIRLVREGFVPDALLTDQMMPGIAGADLATELQARLPGLPVLLITGYARMDTAPAANLKVLAKPFRHADLARAVAALLDGGQPRRALDIEVGQGDQNVQEPEPSRQ